MLPTLLHVIPVSEETIFYRSSNIPEHGCTLLCIFTNHIDSFLCTFKLSNNLREHMLWLIISVETTLDCFRAIVDNDSFL